MPKTIVYSLSHHPLFQGFIPTSYVCDIDRDGQLGYMLKKATPEVIASFQSLPTNETNQECLRICEELTDEALHERFVKTKRNNISKLLADPKTAKPIRSAIEKQINQLLVLISEHKLPLCLNIERKIKLESIRVHPQNTRLSPLLKFVKTNSGIQYTLGLALEGQDAWHPADFDSHMICNQPGWAIFDRQLFQLQHINGNKLKPFLKKKTIIIPDHLSHTYLEKFVHNLISKVKVDLTGFELTEHTKKPSAILRAREDFISNTWILDLLFSYDQDIFHYWAKENQRTRMHYGKNNAVTFSITRRQEAAEKEVIDIIKQYGITVDKTKRLVFTTASPDAFRAIQWLAEHKAVLEAQHIAVEIPQINDHILSCESPDITLTQIEDNDWFDVKAVITIGEQQVPFHELIAHIKTNNRVFEMENGEAFIIPLEWMTQYAGLARWAHIEDNKVSILKSQYGLLEDDTSTNDNSLHIYEAPTEDIKFTLSPCLKAELRPYQRSGVQWLINHQQNGLGCCLADDMGLGKTVQTIAAILHAREKIVKDDAINQPETITENTDVQLDDSAQISSAASLNQPAFTEQLDLFGMSPDLDSHSYKESKSTTKESKRTRHTKVNSPLTNTVVPPSLIVMPSSLLFNWQAEFNKFAPHLFVKKHTGPKRAKTVQALLTHDIMLTSYQTALRDIEILHSVDWQYVVLDESQYIKNHSSKIFAALQGLTADHKLSLSGTPIENSLADLWSQMQFINPDILGSYSFFKKHFQKPIEKVKNESLIDELKTLTKPFLFRRTKEEVLPDLPEKTEQIVYCEMTESQEKIYEIEKSATRNMILQSDLSDPQVKIQVLSSLLRLRQLSNHPALCDADYKDTSGKYEIIKESLSNVFKSGQKAIIFSSFTKHLDLISDYLDNEKINVVSLTGRTSQKNRQKAVNAFQNDESIPFFLISIKAGGTGLNLTAADYVFILDPWWNPFVEEQAIARAHRLGLEHPLNVIRFISKKTIEEKINKLQQKKLKLSAEFIGDGEKMSWTNEELQYLID